MSNAYEEGREAFKRGEGYTLCPYRGSGDIQERQKRAQWFGGWSRELRDTPPTYGPQNCQEEIDQ